MQPKNFICTLAMKRETWSLMIVKPPIPSEQPRSNGSKGTFFAQQMKWISQIPLPKIQLLWILTLNRVHLRGANADRRTVRRGTSYRIQIPGKESCLPTPSIVSACILRACPVGLRSQMSIMEQKDQGLPGPVIHTHTQMWFCCLIYEVDNEHPTFGY